MKNAPVSWIWKNDDGLTDPQMVIFRLKLKVNILPANKKIYISADSRYVFFINGRRVAVGPCRSTADKRYCDEIDVASYLKSGTNILIALVAHFSADYNLNLLFQGGPISVICGPKGGFAIYDEDLELGTDTRWKCQTVESYHFTPIKSQISYMEMVDGRTFPWMIHDIDFDDSKWETVKIIPFMGAQNEYGQQYPWMIENRPIPMPYEDRRKFDVVTRTNFNGVYFWENLINGNSIVIPANKSVWVEFGVNAYQNAFPELTINGGYNTEITIIYAESYMQCQPDGSTSKMIRDDYSTKKSVINGFSDLYIAGDGVQKFVPFFYRSFRFIRMCIITKAEEIVLNNFQFIKTGYPLEVKGNFITVNNEWNQLWDISLRTLRSCMYETYMDCPYYEQLQYCMDTMLQMNYTYVISNDDRLARKAIEDFRCSILSDGMILCCAPSKINHVIPGFAFFWIFMIEEHFRHFGDISIIERYINVIEQVISYFSNHMTEESLVGDTGGWQFVDWVNGWERGSPISSPNELNVIYSMMFVKALKATAIMYEHTGCPDMSRKKQILSEKIIHSLFQYCYDEADGMFFDSPGKLKKSQHAQIWAVLAGVVTDQQAADIMNNTICNMQLHQVSYCMVYFLFRAMNKAGLYALTKSVWNKFLNLLPLNITTLPEDDIDQRSDCHAWSAVALYEFAIGGLGVSPDEAGYEIVRIQPQMLWLESCQGCVTTCKGVVNVSWRIKKGRFMINIDSEVSMNFHVILPSKSEFNYHNHNNIYLEENII